MRIIMLKDASAIWRGQFESGVEYDVPPGLGHTLLARGEARLPDGQTTLQPNDVTVTPKATGPR